VWLLPMNNTLKCFFLAIISILKADASFMVFLFSEIYKLKFAEAWQVNLPLTFIRLASALAPDRLCA
jgi:hypothetical protein